MNPTAESCTHTTLLEHCADCYSANCQSDGDNREECNLKFSLQRHSVCGIDNCMSMSSVECKKIGSLIREHRINCIRDQCFIPTCYGKRNLRIEDIPTITEDSSIDPGRSSGETHGSDKDSSVGKTQKATSSSISNSNGHFPQPHGVRKQRAPYRCGSCGQVKGNAHKCSGSITFRNGMVSVTAFYEYEDETTSTSSTSVDPNQVCASTVSSTTTSTTDDLFMSVTQSSVSEEEDLVTLPTSDSSCTTTTSSVQNSKDAVAKFHRMVKVKNREEKQLIRKLRKVAQSKKNSVNYISDSTSSKSSDSFDSVDRRLGFERLVAESPMWGYTIPRTDRPEASIPCETSIDPRLFTPMFSAPKRRCSESICIFDAKGRVMDVQFDQENKFLQCFDDVDLL